MNIDPVESVSWRGSVEPLVEVTREAVVAFGVLGELPAERPRHEEARGPLGSKHSWAHRIERDY
ncbi:MAG: hypothetical protein H7A36_07140 [Chlamydiales bacterium]|nr:hypothetical protein [Chlamydiales bacterium]